MHNGMHICMPLSMPELPAYLHFCTVCAYMHAQLMGCGWNPGVACTPRCLCREQAQNRPLLV